MTIQAPIVFISEDYVALPLPEELLRALQWPEDTVLEVQVDRDQFVVITAAPSAPESDD